MVFPLYIAIWDEEGLWPFFWSSPLACMMTKSLLGAESFFVAGGGEVKGRRKKRGKSHAFMHTIPQEEEQIHKIYKYTPKYAYL